MLFIEAPQTSPWALYFLSELSGTQKGTYSQIRQMELSLMELIPIHWVSVEI